MLRDKQAQTAIEMLDAQIKYNHELEAKHNSIFNNKWLWLAVGIAAGVYIAK